MKLKAWVDGGARGNPGPAGYGVLIADNESRPVLKLWGFLGSTTNNVAEYRGLLAAVEAALDLGASELEIRTDSELMQRQLTGVYRVKQPHLQQLVAEFQALRSRLRGFAIHHVRREENKDADALANLAMDRGESGRDPAP